MAGTLRTPGSPATTWVTNGTPGKERPLEKFEYQFIEIAKNKLSDLDPGYVEEMEKLKKAMLLAKKGYPG